MKLVNAEQPVKGLLQPDLKDMLVPYALRRVPPPAFATVLPCAERPAPGSIALARLETIGKNARLELVNGRPATLHEGDRLAVVFGNRYATEQFEGYARCHGDLCDLLSMGGLCGLVQSKHAAIPEPSKLRLLGTLGDQDGRPLRMHEFAVPPIPVPESPRIIAVCGSSMDAGKTHTAMSLVMGLKRHGERVGGIKLTGTASGRDTWNLLDAGAFPALDFIDGGYASTHLCPVEDLLNLFHLLLAHAATAGASTVVIEIADGLLQKETSALLQCAAFRKTVQHWLFATGDPMAAESGVRLLRSWDISPLAISGLISMSPLGMREAFGATGVRCITAKELQQGTLNKSLLEDGAPINPSELIPA